MAHPIVHRARRRWVPRWFVLLLVGAWAVSPPAAQAGVIRVEEDWELVVADPDPDCDSPQIVCALSPVGDIASIHAAFELNQCSLPDFQPGGMQLQLWNGEAALRQVSDSTGSVLSTSNETVRWTQSMQILDGLLVFEVSAGSSVTWGAFPHEGTLRVATPTALGSLDGYDPLVSVRNTGAGYAVNRVQSLVLRRVRYFTSSGEMWEDNTVRLVHQQP